MTGAGITGLTNPTYTLVADGGAPQGVTRSWYVSALGGTQPGVTTHTIGSPFTVSWKNPSVLSAPGTVDVSGVYRNPSRRNKYSLIVRKGGKPVPNQPERLNMIRVDFDIEAGVETTDPAQLYALLSLTIGSLTQMQNGIRDTILTGAP